MSIESVMPSNYLILCRPVLLLSSVFPSNRVFSNESVLRIRWPKYLCFSFSISPSNEYSGLISFRMDWFDLLQSKGLSRVFSNSTVQKHKFFSAQSSLHPYMATGQTIALTIWTFVRKVMSLLFNMLSMSVIAILPKSKHLLISCLQSPSTLILELKEKSLSLFPLFPYLFAVKWWDWMQWSLFSECWVLSQLFNSPLSPSSRGSLLPLWFLP